MFFIILGTLFIAATVIIGFVFVSTDAFRNLGTMMCLGGDLALVALLIYLYETQRRQKLQS